MKESPIFTRTYDLLRWLLPVTAKFPRQHRFVLATALQKAAFDFQSHLLEAGHGLQRVSALRRADIELAKLRVYCRLSHDLGLLGSGQFAHVARIYDEIGRLLGGWQKASHG